MSFMKKLVIILGSILVLAGIVFGLWWFLLKPAAPTAPPSAPPAPPPPPSFVDKQLDGMSLRQKVASLLVLHTPGADAATLGTYLQTYQPGGFIFMGDNIPATTDQLAALTAQLQTVPELPYLFAIDEEGGIVKRLAADTYPAAINLKTQPPSATQAAFLQRSTLLKEVGMNLNFGIIADVTSDPDSFIFPRVFGGDPTAVSDRVAAAVTGAKGLTLSTLKHFPGHGETEADSHTSIPVTTVSEERWQQHDKPSFAAGIAAGAEVIMFGHLTYSSVDSVPASLSSKWHETLEKDMGFTGISITDDMIMLQQSGETQYADPAANAVGALKAGNTMLLFVLDHTGGISAINPNLIIDGIVSAVDSGTLSESLIDQNARQVLTLRHSLSK